MGRARRKAATRRGILAAAAFALFLALAAACGGGGETPAGPKLALDGDSFDLGVIKIGELTERTIDFRNEGTEPLTVSIVKVRAAPNADCGCGVEGFEVKPDTIEPGATGQLVFSLKAPDGMSGMQDRMLAELESNDPQQPNVTIAFVFQMLP